MDENFTHEFDAVEKQAGENHSLVNPSAGNYARLRL
jgi:hypothetical protein